MKICHVCKTECEDFFELCPLCGADLMEEESANEQPQEKLIENPVLAATFEDVVSAEIFKDILSDNKVAYASGNEDGEIAIQVRFGGSFVSEDIYVDSSDLERAKELYEEFLNSETEVQFDFEDDFDSESFDGEI